MPRPNPQHSRRLSTKTKHFTINILAKLTYLIPDGAKNKAKLEKRSIATFHTFAQLVFLIPDLAIYKQLEKQNYSPIFYRIDNKISQDNLN